MNPPPKHIAIIMDGNGRWAGQRGLPRLAGHRQGVETVDPIVTAVRDLGIPYLTLYSFSDENWERPAQEVDQLMHLLTEFLETKRAKMKRNGIRLETIGDTARLPQEVQVRLADVQEDTRAGRELTLVLALSYGAHAEICRAVNRVLASGMQEMTPALVQAHLDTAAFPNPDLFIRTSGEFRISNYLLWQLAYTELYFTDVLWPDFTPETLQQAIASYQQRDRRFGKVTA
jgi:undecaprenyl diphosphate synthase